MKEKDEQINELLEEGGAVKFYTFLFLFLNMVEWVVDVFFNNVHVCNNIYAF